MPKTSEQAALRDVPKELDLNKVLARAWLRKELMKGKLRYRQEELVRLLAEFLTDYLRVQGQASLRGKKSDTLKALTEAIYD